jgi:hypothetical protein
MVEIITLNLRSQKTNKGVPRARVAATGRAGLGPGLAWRGVAWRGEARRGRQAGRQAASGRGVIVLIFSTH